MTTIRDLAERTPSTRRRHVDLLRAVAMVAVVLGHWLVIAVHHDAAGNLGGYTALAGLSWLYPLTWLFQVMPIFFLVGGVSNAISWTRHRDSGGTAARWLLDRSGRLLPPVTVLIVAISLGALVAGWAGMQPAMTALAVHLVTMPLWFLVVYLGVIALTPVTHRLHTRFGLLVPLVLILGVAAGDALHLATGNDTWAFGNFVFAWLAVHQLGFAWEDGGLRLTPRRAMALLAGAAGTLLLLTGPGPYPVSMVSVPGAAMQNASPPTLALMALAAVQVCLVVLIAPAAERWLARRRPWTAVIAINSVMLTLYLWHMVAALAGALLLDTLGWLPSATGNEGAFWLGRIPWLLTLTVLQVALIAVFGRIETRSLTKRLAPGASRSQARPDSAARLLARRVLAALRRPLATLPAVTAAYATAILGIYLIAASGVGPHGPLMVPTASVVLLLGAAAALRIGRSTDRTTPVDQPGQAAVEPAAPASGAELSGHREQVLAA